MARLTFEKGFAAPSYVSSTALVTLVSNGKLYVANAGDSKAVLLRKVEGTDTFEQISLNETHSINKKVEQERLSKMFRGETDIYHCQRQPNGKTECYTKGGLQPTRSFGDFRLKFREFNFHKYNESLGFRLPIPIFTGPYISAEPDVRVIELTKDDKFIVLATDGLWKNFPKKDTKSVAQEALKHESHNPNSKEQKPDAPGQKIIRSLMNKTLDKAAADNNVTKQYLNDVAAGPVKRQMIDDVTIMVVDLQNQYQQ